MSAVHLLAGRFYLRALLEVPEQQSKGDAALRAWAVVGCTSLCHGSSGLRRPGQPGQGPAAVPRWWDRSNIHRSPAVHPLLCCRRDSPCQTLRRDPEISVSFAKGHFTSLWALPEKDCKSIEYCLYAHSGALNV